MSLKAAEGYLILGKLNQPAIQAGVLMGTYDEQITAAFKSELERFEGTDRSDEAVALRLKEFKDIIRKQLQAAIDRIVI